MSSPRECLEAFEAAMDVVCCLCDICLDCDKCVVEEIHARLAEDAEVGPEP